MISSHTYDVPKDVVFPSLLYSDSRCFQPCCWRSQVLAGLLLALLGGPRLAISAPRCSQTYHNRFNSTVVPVTRDPSYTGARPECPPTVWYSSEIDVSQFTLYIIWDTPGGSQWLKSILLMVAQINWNRRSSILVRAPQPRLNLFYFIPQSIPPLSAPVSHSVLKTC
jgi:hypothetical protein